MGLGTSMYHIQAVLFQLRRFKSDQRAQDMIEYALLAAFLAVTYGAFWGPSYSSSLARIWARVSFEITRLTGILSLSQVLFQVRV